MSTRIHGPRPTKLATLAIALAILALGPGGAEAEDRIDALIEQLQRQNQEIEALKKEVAELRGKVEPAAAPCSRCIRPESPSPPTPIWTVWPSAPSACPVPIWTT